MARRVAWKETGDALVDITRWTAWSRSLTAASLVTLRWGRSRSIDCSKLVVPSGDAPYKVILEAVMSSSGKSSAVPAGLSLLNLNAAGIDVGAGSHFVAVPAERTEQPVREFEAFTADLYRLAGWLAECGVETVVMESTGVYWIPLFGVLEERGFQVMLVDPRRIKNVPGRKTDVLDCQWLQQLHTYGLLSGAFRPEDEIRRLRSYLRQRAMLVEHAAQHVQHMQKALTQMNVKLHHVIRDITGKTGMDIIEAIVQGERNPRRLARLRDPRTKSGERSIAKSLQGHWRQEHLFELTQALELYRTYQAKMAECDLEIEAQLKRFVDRSGRRTSCSTTARGSNQRNAPSFDVQGQPGGGAAAGSQRATPLRQRPGRLPAPEKGPSGRAQGHHCHGPQTGPYHLLHAALWTPVRGRRRGVL